MIPVYRPYLPEEAIAYARDALSSGWVSSRGEYVERATELLKAAFGHKHVVLTSSGTAAGHLVAIALRRCRPAVTKIFVPNNVYVAAWNTLLYEYPASALHALDADSLTWQALKPHIVDSRTEALLVVHNVGGVVNVARIKDACPKLAVIEDNCEGLFGTYGGKPTGSLALASSMSFFANKTITSGEGGAFATDDDNAFAAAAKAANQGMTDERYVHDALGYNYRMTNVQASLLYGQLLLRDRIRAMKRQVFDAYRQALPQGRVVLQAQEHGAAAADWMMGVRVLSSRGYAHAERFMAERGVEVRPMFHPITRHAHLRGVRCSSDAVADLLHRECFMLPSFPGLGDDDLARVVDAVRAYAEAA